MEAADGLAPRSDFVRLAWLIKLQSLRLGFASSPLVIKLADSFQSSRVKTCTSGRETLCIRASSDSVVQPAISCRGENVRGDGVVSGRWSMCVHVNLAGNARISRMQNQSPSMTKVCQGLPGSMLAQAVAASSRDRDTHRIPSMTGTERRQDAADASHSTTLGHGCSLQSCRMRIALGSSATRSPVSF